MDGMISPTLVKVKREDEASVDSVVDEEFEARTRQREARNFNRAKMRLYIASLYGDPDTTLSAIIESVQEEFELEVPLTVKQVQGHIKAQVEMWRKESLKHIDEKLAMVLARIEQIEELATEAYFNSMQGKVVHYYENQIDKARERKTQTKMRERALKKPTPETDLLEEALWEEAERKAEASNSDDFGHTSMENMLVTTAQKIKEYKRFEETSAGDKGFLVIMLECARERAKLWGLYVKDKSLENPDAEFARLSDTDRAERMSVLVQGVKARMGLPQRNTMAQLAPHQPLGGFKSLEEKKERVGEITEDESGETLYWKLEDNQGRE